MLEQSEKQEEAAGREASGVDAVIINLADLLGDFIDKDCPKCGAQMLGNNVGDEWCSFTECDYGCEDAYKALGL